MTGPIFLQWFTFIFLPATAHKRSGRTPVVLILDGFKAHTELGLLELAAANNVQVVALAPHSTHVAQQLDVALMSPLKRHYDTSKDVWRIIDKDNTLRVRACTREECSWEGNGQQQLWADCSQACCAHSASRAAPPPAPTRPRLPPSHRPAGHRHTHCSLHSGAAAGHSASQCMGQRFHAGQHPQCLVRDWRVPPQP